MNSTKFGQHSPNIESVRIAQAQDPAQDDPLISEGSNMAIYIGLALLVAVSGFAITAISKKVEYALLFAFTLAAILIAFALLA